MTETHQHLHIPLSIQNAAKMIKEMISAQDIVVRDIESGNIRLTNEDKPLFHTLARDIDFYLNTIRFLIFSKFTQAIAGHDPRDETIGVPLTEVPDGMTVELITDELNHEPNTERPDQSGSQTDKLTDIDSAIAITEGAYTDIHEFNPQTKDYSTSEDNQTSFDDNMQYAFTSLKIQYHMLIKAKDKNFPQNKKWSGH